MIRIPVAWLLLLLGAGGAARAAGNVLIVADEMPQMDLLVRILAARAHTHAVVVRQEEMPTALFKYDAVFVFIHHELREAVEKALIDYTTAGGRLIVLHHSISQGKGKNKYWFPFLGVKLTPGDPDRGFYKWINPVTYTVVNLAPGNYLTSHDVHYETSVRYRSSDLGTPEREYPAFVLRNSEVFLNHTFTDGKDKTIVLGFKWQDPNTGKIWMQDRAGWYKRSGKGWTIYLQPGHSLSDFENGAYSQILLNALQVKLR